MGIDFYSELEWVEERIKAWQHVMQTQKLSTFTEFVKYSKIVTKLNRRRKFLRDLIERFEQ